MKERIQSYMSQVDITLCNSARIAFLAEYALQRSFSLTEYYSTTAKVFDDRSAGLLVIQFEEQPFLVIQASWSRLGDPWSHSMN